jgi:nucleotide-binding universal stress UspA family protein
VTDGEPVGALLSVADRQRADLLVVGTRGAGGFAGLHLGSVAHHLAHHTTRPLGIIPLQGAELPPDTIVLGVDGSAGSDAAVRWTAALAPAIGARVVAVHATEPFLEWLPESDRRGWRQKAAVEAGRWVNPIRHAGGEVQIVIARNVHPVAAVASVAREHDAGLAVVGTRGLGGFTGLRLGRVPIQLVHHLGRPVVMVPPPA